MDDGRYRSPYRGVVVSTLVLIIVPLSFFLVIYSWINKYDRRMTDEMKIYSSMMFGFGTGSLFHMICILYGILKSEFKIVFKRILNFISNLFVSPRVAFICYKSELKEGGFVFWIDLSIILICFHLFLIGLDKCLQFYINY